MGSVKMAYLRHDILTSFYSRIFSQIELTLLAVLSRKTRATNADSLATLAVSGTIGNDALGVPYVTFRAFPAIYAVTLTPSVDSVSTTQKRAHT